MPRHIFPVFAGMVPGHFVTPFHILNFPRIRGDGPSTSSQRRFPCSFSPYSRGWSPAHTAPQQLQKIFPVFAGMVPGRRLLLKTQRDFPRIRGDGPVALTVRHLQKLFSPYSRGWSRMRMRRTVLIPIFPVFAGMVPEAGLSVEHIRDFPRIRGDGPTRDSCNYFDE